MTFEYSGHILKNAQISNLIKMCSLGAELFHADGRTKTKITFAFAALRTCPKRPVLDTTDATSYRNSIKCEYLD
jgi:hypothetical protein